MALLSNPLSKLKFEKITCKSMMMNCYYNLLVDFFLVFHNDTTQYYRISLKHVSYFENHVFHHKLNKIEAIF